jgi:hypothetical protein
MTLLDDKITVLDNFISLEQLKAIRTTIENGSWISHQSTDAGIEFLNMDVTNDPYYNTELLNHINKQLNIKFKLGRVYFNGQYPGREGAFHTDDDSPKNHTVIIYTNKVYSWGWGGFTEFIDPKSGDHKVVAPVLYRAVFFPANILHKAYAFTQQDCPMRTSLNFKLEGE